MLSEKKNMEKKKEKKKKRPHRISTWFFEGTHLVYKLLGV